MPRPRRLRPWPASLVGLGWLLGLALPGAHAGAVRVAETRPRTPRAAALWQHPQVTQAIRVWTAVAIEFFRLPTDVTVTPAPCGRMDGFYDPVQQLHLCEELLIYYAGVLTPPGGDPRSPAPVVRDATLVSFLHLVWQHVNVLLPGAVLAPGTRTVTSMLQMRGRRAASDFQTSHRGRTRAVWSPRTASRLLRRLVVAVCSPAGGVGFGRDDTMERRRGAQSTATGLSRAPVQSSHAHGVNVSGRRWLAGRLRGPLAWADRVGARPWRTVRWPSERFEAPRGRRQQPLTARAGQRIRRVVRWMPGRESALVPDSRVAALELRATVTTVRRGRVRVRLRLDAALSAPPPPRVPGTIGRPRLQGQRRPTLEAVLAAERTPWTPAHVAQGRGAPPRARRPASLAGRVRSR